MARRSNDKATRSPIERLFYAPPTTKPGDEISHSRLTEREIETRYDDEYERPGNPLGRYTVSGIPCTVIDSTECGDYSSNALVGESNYRTMKAEFPWLVEIYGSHGFKSLAYLGKRENQSDALIEAIDSLADYPLYSEDDHSQLEIERESEAWEEDGANDFRKALRDILDECDTLACSYCNTNGSDDDCDGCNGSGRVAFEHDPDLISDDDLYSLWRDGCDAFNVNGGSGCINEQGDSIHFYIDEWIENYARNPQRAYNYGDHAGETFAERIKTLAVVCRTHTEDSALVLVARDAWLQDPNGDLTIKLLNQIAPDYHAAILYAWEWEQERNVSEAKEDSK